MDRTKTLRWIYTKTQKSYKGSLVGKVKSFAESNGTPEHSIEYVKRIRTFHSIPLCMDVTLIWNASIMLCTDCFRRQVAKQHGITKLSAPFLSFILSPIASNNQTKTQTQPPTRRKWHQRRFVYFLPDMDGPSPVRFDSTSSKKSRPSNTWKHPVNHSLPLPRLLLPFGSQRRSALAC